MFYNLNHELTFPHPESVKPSGILAIQGDLTVERLLLAYHYGIFPWYNPSDPIIWWCPKPRFVIYPDKIKVAKSMKSYFNQNKYQVTYDQHFAEVMRFCQFAPRHDQDGTWINDQLVESYTQLNKMGFARSVEVWDGDDLVGGLYGVVLGKIFFGESMFSLKSNASKFGFISLAKKLFEDGFYVIDCQQPNPFLTSLGGEFISGELFQSYLHKNRLASLNDE
ncbi:MAG: leucyl/phenylalanyl-tRNA--protein transferase [Saprospiraceae bacterium]